MHFLRNLLAQRPEGHAQEMVAAAIRTIFAQPDAASVRAQLDIIAAMLGRQFPKVETMLRDAAEDITAFADFPAAHWKKIWSTNPLERVNKEIKRRTDVVGVFPNPAALLRLAGAVLVEIHDEWQVSDRRYLSEASMALLTDPTHRTDQGGGAPGTDRVIVQPAPATAKTTHRRQLHHSAGRDRRLACRHVGEMVDIEYEDVPPPAIVSIRSRLVSSCTDDRGGGLLLKGHPSLWRRRVSA